MYVDWMPQKDQDTGKIQSKLQVKEWIITVTITMQLKKAKEPATKLFLV